MSTLGVHRVVERQAVVRGDRTAVSGAHGGLTYRELNQRANMVARHLMACGLRRGSRVVVRMARSPQLAVVLLAVLKAGAAYMWVDGEAKDRWPRGVSIVHASNGADETLVVVDDASLVEGPSRPAPNLPIVTRPDDIACVLPPQGGVPAVLVPHATIAALRSHPAPDRTVWSGDAAAFDLWLPLMAGGTVMIAASAVEAAA
ncbi:MAG: AMP-binding protein [Vicinamibacterales bacterium]